MSVSEYSEDFENSQDEGGLLGGRRSPISSPAQGEGGYMSMNMLQMESLDINSLPAKFSGAGARSVTYYDSRHQSDDSEYENDFEHDDRDHIKRNSSTSSRETNKQTPILNNFLMSSIVEGNDDFEYMPADNDHSELPSSTRSKGSGGKRKKKSKHRPETEPQPDSRQSPEKHKHGSPSGQSKFHSMANAHVIEEAKYVQFKAVPALPNRGERQMPVAAVQSNIANNTKHSQYVLQKQLEAAIKKINVYSKENAELQNKLDTSSMGMELQRLRGILVSQDHEIKKLIDENRSLRAVNRNCTKVIVEHERSKDTEEQDSALTAEGQVKILLERTRRLSTQLNDARVKERNVLLENEKLQRRNNRLKLHMAKIQEDQLAKEQALLLAASGEEGSMAIAAPARPLFVDVSTQTDDDYKATVERVGRLSETVGKLNKALKVNKEMSAADVNSLKVELGKAVVLERRLDNELQTVKQEIRSQLATIMSLKDKNAELLDANHKLTEANALLQNALSAMPTIKPQVPVASKPSSSSRRTVVSTSRATPVKKGGVLQQDDEQEGLGGNATFLTSDAF